MRGGRVSRQRYVPDLCPFLFAFRTFDAECHDEFPFLLVTMYGMSLAGGLAVVRDVPHRVVDNAEIDQRDGRTGLGPQLDFLYRASETFERAVLRVEEACTGNEEAVQNVGKAKLTREEGRLHWRQGSGELARRVRAFSPRPGAWCEIAENGKPVRVKVLRSTRGDGAGVPGTLLDDCLTVACGAGAVRLVKLQRAGRQAMAAEEFLRGIKLTPGARLAL
jgi:hypothetical protein